MHCWNSHPECHLSLDNSQPAVHFPILVVDFRKVEFPVCNDEQIFPYRFLVNVAEQLILMLHNTWKSAWITIIKDNNTGRNLSLIVISFAVTLIYSKERWEVKIKNCVYRLWINKWWGDPWKSYMSTICLPDSLYERFSGKTYHLQFCIS